MYVHRKIRCIFDALETYFLCKISLNRNMLSLINYATSTSYEITMSRYEWL